MKMDKTGACTVIAAAVTVARLAPGTPLLVLAPAVENMPGPHSTRPGDVVKALNGKWVDITNTDAEGRLILADALTYAEQLGATHLVDVATLTGAVARALGELVSGAFGTPQAFVDDVFAAGARAGERYWQLPLIEEYRADMESWYGDLVNFSRNNEGGLVKSAMFIQRVRDEALGPPRHRRHGVLPEGRAVRRARRHRRRPTRPSSSWRSPARRPDLRPGRLARVTTAPLARPAARARLWGFASDRLAARWPEHEDGSIRRVDWRTPIVVVARRPGVRRHGGEIRRGPADPADHRRSTSPR